MLSLTEARQYLGERAYVQTPLGAREFLACVQFRERDLYRDRIKTALECLKIYRFAFPEQYSRSTAPLFSIQREQELYRLVHRYLLPLFYVGEHRYPASNDQVEEVLVKHPDWFVDVIPLRSAQEHFWCPGAFSFRDVAPAYQVALALSLQCDPHQEHWPLLKQLYELDCPDPLPPIAAVGWTLFRYACAIEGRPMVWLEYAFNAISYKTGNVMLDMPPIGAMGFKWSLEELMRMSLMWANAMDFDNRMEVLSAWLLEDPKRRIARIVAIWNEAAGKEQESGYAGMLIDNETVEMYAA